MDTIVMEASNVTLPSVRVVRQQWRLDRMSCVVTLAPHTVMDEFKACTFSDSN